MRIIVIGAGPGGLTFAKTAIFYGAHVDVLEKAGDPRGNDAGYTDRSFNLTLNSVGRAALGDRRVWNGSTNVIGRAVHVEGNNQEIKFADFGESDAAILTSVPRPVLRQNMVEVVESLGAKLHFHSKAVNFDPDTGEVVISRHDGLKNMKADLIVVADGMRSIADKYIQNMPQGNLNWRMEKLNYVTVMIKQAAAQGLSLNHIHFWRRPDCSALAIGLPNKDGSIAALLVSDFADVDPEKSPFETPELATERLKRDFPGLLELEPSLSEQVLGRRRGRFFYKSITDYILGSKCIVVGDAGSASPPWAGFGANTAIYSADALARFIAGQPDNIENALKGFEDHKIILAKMVLDYADEHGEFLNKRVVDNPSDRPIGPVLEGLVKEAIIKSEIPEGVRLLSL